MRRGARSFDSAFFKCYAQDDMSVCVVFILCKRNDTQVVPYNDISEFIKFNTYTLFNTYLS